MSGFNIIDRRKNPKSKSLSNRQRFVERAKKAIRESAKKALGNKGIGNYDSGDTVVNIPSDGLDEPRFRSDSESGEYDFVLPGNNDYVPGDTIKKPDKNGKGGRGTDGSPEGEGEDEFSFALTNEEFLNIIFDDLELPDLVKQSEKHAVSFVPRRAGHTNSGNPSNLNVEKTALAGLGRRIALRSPKYKELHALEDELKAIEALIANKKAKSKDNVRKEELILEISAIRRRINAITYLDGVDMRFNNFVNQPRPITKAVMFCMMDVSFSMGEREKIIAKKFFILLHLFLKRRYKDIDVVFVRHHDKAVECDEDTFFTSREGGGTVVSTGYKLIQEIISDRYDINDWNIYMAQASDGDNYSNDNEKVTKCLSEELLPITQHFTYIEIDDPRHREFIGMHGGMVGGASNLWMTISPLSKLFDNISCAQISDETEVIRVFRNLFKQDRKES